MKSKETILKECVIGINKEALGKHHDFLPSILKAMDIYAEQFESKDFIPYQTCPVCNGTGKEKKEKDFNPLTYWTGTCTVCSGTKIIPMYKVEPPIKEQK